MSALGQKRTCAVQNGMSALPPIATAKADSRFTAESGHVQRTSSCLLWAKSGHRAILFDQLVAELEQSRRHCDAECFGRFEVDDKRELTRLFDRQISRFGALEDLVDIDRGALVHVFIARSVGHQASDLNKLLVCVHIRQPLPVGEVHYALAIM